MVTYGLTTLFVAGSLWYLDLLPLQEFPKPNALDTGQAQRDADDARSTDDQQTAEAALADVEQWEPDVTTTDDLDADVPASPAAMALQENSKAPPSSSALPFPPAPETGSSVNTTASNVVAGEARSSSERDRIARIFGKAGPAPDSGIGIPETSNAATETAGSRIIPASAERPVPTRSTVADDALSSTDQSFAQVDEWIAEGQYLKAHRELSQRYWKEQEPLEPLLQRLNKTAGMIYFAPNAHFMKSYKVQSGDLLQSIAPRYKLSWEYLARLNRVRPERIRPGQELKVIKGPFSAFVDLSDFSLTIHAHGYFVKRYPIGIGKENSTPIGTFSVKEKLKNPKYYGSDEVIEADDPDNPLGERWIGIGNSYGIHGTIEPNSIGKAESRGCLRLTNDDAAEVYDFLVPGSEVVIRP